MQIMSMRHSSFAGAGGASSSSASSWTLKCTDLPQFDALQKEADRFRTDDKLHLRNLCNDTARCAGLTAIHESISHMNYRNSSKGTRNGVADGGGSGTPGGYHSHHHLDSHQTDQRNHHKLVLDYSRQRVTGETMELLFDLGDAVGFMDRREAMRTGERINLTEEQPVLHHVLRMPAGYHIQLNTAGRGGHRVATAASGANGSSGVHMRAPLIQEGAEEPLHGPTLLREILAVREKILEFSTEVRSGRYRSVRNKHFKNVLCIGTGGFAVGPSCVAEALKADPICEHEAAGRQLRFLTNVDPTDFYLQTCDWDPAETLVIITSKTFADVHTTLNARTARQWLVEHLAKEGTSETEIVARHMVAVSASRTRCIQFGIQKTNVFRIWDWVDGRYSVCSAVGLLPLALQFSYYVCSGLLEGAHDMDEHFFHAPLRDNIPVILGLLGVWNSTFLGSDCRVILPYCQALWRLPAYVQHVDMESNGKRVALDGTPLLHGSGEINFGDVGTCAEHNFFQLLHQGRVIPADFIGFMESNQNFDLPGEDVSSHDELMSNFFAQPDALAYGKTLVDLIQEGAPEPLREHMVYPGNRPSSSILLTRLDAYSIGQLLAMYEHRTAVQGFMWGINSFDQFGIELGKIMAKGVRAQLCSSRKTGASVQGFNSSTTSLLGHYLKHGQQQN